MTQCYKHCYSKYILLFFLKRRAPVSFETACTLFLSFSCSWRWQKTVLSNTCKCKSRGFSGSAASLLRPQSVSLFSLPWDQTSCWRGISLVTSVREETHGSLGQRPQDGRPRYASARLPVEEEDERTLAWGRTARPALPAAGSHVNWCSQGWVRAPEAEIKFFSGMAIAIKNEDTSEASKSRSIGEALWK